jgi:hypothetical protein
MYFRGKNNLIELNYVFKLERAKYLIYFIIIIFFFFIYNLKLLIYLFVLN